MRALAAVLMVCAGCHHFPEIDLDVTIDAAAGDVASLVVGSSENGFTKELQLSASQRSARAVRITYQAEADSGTVDITLYGLSSSGGCLARGAVTGVPLDTGRPLRRSITVTRDASCVVAVPDMGGTPADLSGLVGTGCPGGVLFCDTFDTDTTIDPRWAASANGDELIIDQSVAGARGSPRSLRVKVSGTAHEATPGIGSLGIPTTGPLYLRWYMRSQSPWPAPLPETLLVFSRDGQGKGVDLYVNDSGNIGVGTFGYTTNTSQDWGQPPGSSYRCYELYVDPALQKLQLSVDGSMVADVPSFTQNPTWDRFVLGFNALVPAGTATTFVWYDEIIIDDKPIGCVK